MKRLFRFLLYNLLVIVIILAVLEAGCRIILRHTYNRDFDSSLIVDDKYLTSAGLKENATGTVWGKEFHTDEFACRKSSKPYNKQKRKWLYIGDSVTEGVGVDDTSTFAAIVAAHTDSINILNYSLIGYSVADYYNVLKCLLDKNDSSISKATVFFCLNDVYGSTKPNQLPEMAQQNWKGKLNSLLQNRYATYKVLKLLLLKTSDRYFQYDNQFYNQGDPHFKEAMHYLRGCDSLCRAHRVKMNVVMLPYHSQLGSANDIMQQPQDLVRDYCEKHQIPFADVLETLKNRVKPRSEYLLGDEIHFSEVGHRVVADFILSH